MGLCHVMNGLPLRFTVLTALIAAACAAPSPSPTPPPPSPPPIAKSSSPSTPPAPLALDRCPAELRNKILSAPPGYQKGPVWPTLSVIPDLGWPDRGGFSYKVPWTTTVPEGDLVVTVERIDAAGRGKGEATRAWGESPSPGERFFAGSVWVPSPGCWRVTGSVGQASITFAFKQT